MHDVIPYFPCQSIKIPFFLFPFSFLHPDQRLPVLLIGQRIIWYIRPQSTPPSLSQKKIFSSRILISTNTTSASLLLIHTMPNLSAKLFNSCDRFIGGSFWLVSRFFRQQMRRKITLHLIQILLKCPDEYLVKEAYQTIWDSSFSGCLCRLLQFKSSQNFKLTSIKLNTIAWQKISTDYKHKKQVLTNKLCICSIFVWFYTQW